MDVNGSNDANVPVSSTLKKFFPMAKGDGEESYCKNSQFQAFITKVPIAISALDEALETMTLPTTGRPVRVVDLGCASGPNTIATVAHIVDKLRHRLPEDAEFQAYFNDVPSNDFNNLFQLLNSDSRARTFYAAGVPGSFYGNLFPQSSVHIFHSSNSLHWLSKIPDEVLDKDSPAYNRGDPWYQHPPSAVARAYQQQALIDLNSFLLTRAAELVSGGLLFFIMNGSSRGETSEPNEVDGDLVNNVQSDLTEVLIGLVAEGLLTQHKLDTFNIPVYHRSSEDVRKALKCCSSMFNVMIIKQHEVSLSDAFADADGPALSKKLSGIVKAGLKHQIEAHVGKNVSDVIWQRLDKLIEKNIGTRPNNLSIWLIGLIRR